ncbi:MAG: dienelactone hydrolase [Proteobacteria bacterium]|nr:dienelactone hydrolase [Pseudomonadota bacterium]
MRRLRGFAAIVLTGLAALAATHAQAAGLKSIEVPADAAGPLIKAIVWTPCNTAPGQVVMGPFTLPGVRDCAVAGDHLGLVVVSHGYGGNALGHHDTAEALADAGFVAVALDHPDDTTSNKDPAANVAALAHRPTDVKRVIDYMLTGWPDARRIDPARIGFFGFSRGGYTGLVIGGANPDFVHAHVRCPGPPALCAPMQAASPLTHDPRVRAIVIADPLSFFPTRDSLKDVKVPLQLWSSERGGDGVSPEDVAAVARDLPVRPDFHRVPGTAHFAFLTPCPPVLTKEIPQICVDDGGFDRVAFHRRLDAEVVDFLRAHLAPAAKP